MRGEPKTRGLPSKVPRLQLGDLIAGVSVALVLIPQSLAYAELAGLPAYHGLYAATFPLLVAALLASSPYLQTGPVAMTALLTYGALHTLAPAGTEQIAELAALLALTVGILRIALGWLRLGSIITLLTPPVLLGFTSGAALLIVASQVPAVLGQGGQGGVLERAATALLQLSKWDWAGLGFGTLTVALMLGGRRLHPLFPGILVAVILCIALSLMLGYAGAKLGQLPASFPPFSLELPWPALPSLILPAFIIAVVGFAEPASIARTFAQRENQPWDPDREFTAQGWANIVAGVSAGFPVGGSFSRSALNHLAGAKTRLAGLVTGIAVLAFLPFMGLLAAMPKATLGAAVMAAVLGLIQFKPFLALWRVSRAQLILAVITLLLTLALSPRIDLAVLIGVGLTLIEREVSSFMNRTHTTESVPGSPGDATRKERSR